MLPNFTAFPLVFSTLHYVAQQGNPFWMPELGLGIGTERGLHEGPEREWLYWYDPAGHQYPAPEHLIAQERQLREQAEQAQQEAQRAQQEAEQAQQEAQRAQQEAQQAQQETEQMARTLVRRQLSRQLGQLPSAALYPLEQLSMPQIEALSDDLWSFTSAADFSAWLQNTLSQ